MIRLSFCRVGHHPGRRWYTKNLDLHGQLSVPQVKLLEALGIRPPYKAQYVIEVCTGVAA